MTNKEPIFSIFCIDYRFDALVATFYENIGQEYNYFACTSAGGCLSLGYESYCKEICNSHKPCNKPCKPCNKCNECNECNECNKCNECNDYNKKKCDPDNSSMRLLKLNLVENLKIALTLKDITKVFLLNHQDCGAIKAYLNCSGYPNKLGENNKKEIKINSILLTYAKKYMLKKFPDIEYALGLVDINGSVAIYDICKKTWKVVYVGEFKIKEGLWYGLKVGDIYKI